MKNKFKILLSLFALSLPHHADAVIKGPQKEIYANFVGEAICSVRSSSQTVSLHVPMNGNGESFIKAIHEGLNVNENYFDPNNIRIIYNGKQVETTDEAAELPHSSTIRIILNENSKWKNIRTQLGEAVKDIKGNLKETLNTLYANASPIHLTSIPYLNQGIWDQVQNDLNEVYAHAHRYSMPDEHYPLEFWANLVNNGVIKSACDNDNRSIYNLKRAMIPSNLTLKGIQSGQEITRSTGSEYARNSLLRR